MRGWGDFCGIELEGESVVGVDGCFSDGFGFVKSNCEE